jgi:hypothetical protein
MPFAVPMVWRKRKDHATNCYFCITKIKGILRKFKKSVKYPNIPSAIRPISHSKQLPVPVPPTTWSLDSEEDTGEADVQTDPGDEENEDSDFLPGIVKSPNMTVVPNMGYRSIFAVCFHHLVVSM